MPEDNIRTELLQTNLVKNEAVHNMLRGAQALAEGGIEGIQDVAKTNPDILLSAIIGLASVVGLQQEELNRLFEVNMEIVDRVESIAESIPKE